MDDLKEEMMNAEEGLQIGPLIDVVFLLLIYFILTSSLKSPEGDLGIALPGSQAISETINMPDEQMIEITADGDINLNNNLFPSNGGRNLPELVTLLQRYKSASDAANNKAMITIQAENTTQYQRVIDVLNACAQADIKHVTVGMGDEE